MSSKIKQSLRTPAKGHCASSVKTNVLQPPQPNEARGRIMIPPFEYSRSRIIKEKKLWNRSHVVTCWQRPLPEVS
jgi:hypothetical protein